MGNCAPPAPANSGARGTNNNCNVNPPSKFGDQQTGSKRRFETSNVAPAQIDVNDATAVTEKLPFVANEHLHEQWKVRGTMVLLVDRREGRRVASPGEGRAMLT